MFGRGYIGLAVGKYKQNRYDEWILVVLPLKRFQGQNQAVRQRSFSTHRQRVQTLFGLSQIVGEREYKLCLLMPKGS